MDPLSAAGSRLLLDGTPATGGSDSETGAWLQAHGLEHYAESFVALGYHRLVLLRGMDEKEETELISDHKMPRPHARALKHALQELRAASPDSLASSLLTPQSCSPSLIGLDVPLLLAAEAHQPVVVQAVAARGRHGHGGCTECCARRWHCSSFAGSRRGCPCPTTPPHCSTVGMVLLVVAFIMSFVYMDICGDAWSDGDAPSWCWPRPNRGGPGAVAGSGSGST